MRDAVKNYYPFTGRTLDLDGLAYHYLDEGKGAPVVMVHGNPSWSFYYRNLVLALRDNYRCIVPDHIGCGFSDKPGDDRYDYTLSRRIDDLEHLIDSLDLQGKITLVVHDWGGMIGMGYASRHPERIGRIVVLNTAAFHLPKEKKFPLGLKICRDTLLGTLLVRGFNAFSVGASIVGCKKNPMPQELMKAYRAPYDSWQNRIATLRFVQDIPLAPGDRGYDLVSEIAAGLERFSDLPMAIFWGELDFVFDTTFLAEWKRRFPKAQVHSYPDAGHYVLEDMKGEVVPLIVEFLQQTEARETA
ncbi:alpha/beta fold hydrolase [Geomonas sp. Red69]|uniref:Alpha/beta fold hydrolase n=1 Tax=Geomonas diazotrophica TaxID=2843197 RepID=A0ABX8JV92_9BACT|nr:MULTISPECIES: alpha/beta fold hydrolase [Geomonas]MBU5637550.1 alpha/beta fold hydrolase [Geomonas diazotrophica]QWV99330.1 alpha/beta fold hydrolase [Geomonas nitrogeniifigens]QXE88497.1 alpha/beta fold hydrolase [Geomonas nitrogeniifigens]